MVRHHMEQELKPTNLKEKPDEGGVLDTSPQGIKLIAKTLQVNTARA